MEEISLRELIEIILKGKWIIVIVTVACMLISGVVSFALPPVYEAQATLMISPLASNISSASMQDNNFVKLVDTLSQYPQMTIDTYKEQVKTPAILAHIREEMGLNGTSLKAIASKISVNSIKGTNLINISVKDNDPEFAAKMTNLISERFTQFVSETGQKQAESSAEFIKSQSEREKENLDDALEELKNFLSQPRGPEELRLELDSKLTQLTEFKARVAQVRIEEQSTRTSLDHAKKLMSDIPKTLVIDKALLSDDIVSGILKDKSGLDTEDLAGLKMSSEEINEVYTDIAKHVNNLEIHLADLTANRISTENEITQRQKEIESIQAELAVKQQQYDILNHDVQLIRQTYDAYQQKYKEMMIKQSAEVGKSSIIAISEAIPPMRPVSPNKKLNLAIAGVLGLMASVFAVFIMEYWKNSGSTITVSQ